MQWQPSPGAETSASHSRGGVDRPAARTNPGDPRQPQLRAPRSAGPGLTERAAGRRGAGGRRVPVRPRGRTTRGRARPGGGVPAGLRSEARTAGKHERPRSPLGPPCDFESGARDRSLETVTPCPSSRGRRRASSRCLRRRQVIGYLSGGGRVSEAALGTEWVAWRLPQWRSECLSEVVWRIFNLILFL